MPLSIGVSTGTMIQIGTEVLRVTKVRSRSQIAVSFTGRSYLLEESKPTEIAPEVYVSCGMSKHPQSQGARLAFQAPISIKIVRLEEKS